MNLFTILLHWNHAISRGCSSSVALWFSHWNRRTIHARSLRFIELQLWFLIILLSWFFHRLLLLMRWRLLLLSLYMSLGRNSVFLLLLLMLEGGLSVGNMLGLHLGHGCLLRHECNGWVCCTIMICKARDSGCNSACLLKRGLLMQ